MKSKPFNVNDRDLIEGAAITGQPAHVAAALAAAKDGFRARMGSTRAVNGRAVIILSAAVKSTYFDEYAVASALQEIADAEGVHFEINYTGPRAPRASVPVSPDVTFVS